MAEPVADAAADVVFPVSTRLDREAVRRAVESLLRWIAAQARQRKAQLLEHDEPLRLLISLRRIPATGRTNPYLIPLSHPVHSLSGPNAASVCLIADDRSSAPASLSTVKERICAEGINVSEVITLSSLRSDYKPYEARRKLCGSYDVFLADRRLLQLLPSLLGKHFFKKKKQPLPVDLSRKGWPLQLRRCLGSAALYIRTGTCCQLDIGRASQRGDEIVENVIMAVEGAMRYIPKKWDNVRSIHLKSDESVALPIYRALPKIGFKIDTAFGKKAVPDATEEAGEFTQSKKRGKKKENKVLGSEKRQRKDRRHEVRYMDTNLDNDGLVSGLASDNEEGSKREENELLAEEKVKASKKTKGGKLPRANVQADDRCAKVDETKKRKRKEKKSDGKGVKAAKAVKQKSK